MAALEKPKYVVLKALSAAKRGFFSSENVAEIRQYAPMLVAEVEFNAKEGSAEGVKDINSTSRSGFRSVRFSSRGNIFFVEEIHLTPSNMCFLFELTYDHLIAFQSSSFIYVHGYSSILYDLPPYVYQYAIDYY